MKDITYCTSTDCPSSECRIKLLNNKIPAGEIISMSDFSKECRFYAGWFLTGTEKHFDGEEGE